MNHTRTIAIAIILVILAECGANLGLGWGFGARWSLVWYITALGSSVIWTILRLKPGEEKEKEKEWPYAVAFIVSSMISIGIVLGDTDGLGFGTMAAKTWGVNLLLGVASLGIIVFYHFDLAKFGAKISGMFLAIISLVMVTPILVSLAQDLNAKETISFGLTSNPMKCWDTTRGETSTSRSSIAISDYFGNNLISGQLEIIDRHDGRGIMINGLPRPPGSMNSQRTTQRCGLDICVTQTIGQSESALLWKIGDGSVKSLQLAVTRSRFLIENGSLQAYLSECYAELK